MSTNLGWGIAYFFRLDHSLDHDLSEVGKYGGVLVFPQGIAGMHARVHCTSSTSKWTRNHLSHIQERAHISYGERLHLLKELLNQLVPVFQADLEYLAIFDLRYPDQIEMGVCQVVLIWVFLNELVTVRSCKKCFFGCFLPERAA
jgi:hypothetical protein